MEMSFFQLAERVEQNKRHLTILLNLCMARFVDGIPSSTFEYIKNYRDNHGFEETYIEIYNNILPRRYQIFLKHIKWIYSIDEETFIEVIGFEELLPELRTPDYYTQEQDFKLLIDLFLLGALDGINLEQSRFISRIGRLLNYNNEQIMFISNKISDYRDQYNFFEQIEELQNILSQDFLSRYITFPPSSHLVHD
jgi:hypothetical protein